MCHQLQKVDSVSGYVASKAARELKPLTHRATPDFAAEAMSEQVVGISFFCKAQHPLPANTKLSSTTSNGQENNAAVAKTKLTNLFLIVVLIVRVVLHHTSRSPSWIGFMVSRPLWQAEILVKASAWRSCPEKLPRRLTVSHARSDKGWITSDRAMTHPN